jgi:hypothetical protein
MHSLHNTVRTGRKITLTGLGALNEINNYLLLFFIERNFEKYQMPEYCKFSELYSKYCTDTKIMEDSKIDYTQDNAVLNSNYYKVWNEWCNVKNLKCILRVLTENHIIRKYLKNEVIAYCAYTDEPETGKNIQKLINTIWNKFSSIAGSKKSKKIINLSS